MAELRLAWFRKWKLRFILLICSDGEQAFRGYCFLLHFQPSSKEPSARERKALVVLMHKQGKIWSVLLVLDNALLCLYERFGFHLIPGLRWDLKRQGDVFVYQRGSYALCIGQPEQFPLHIRPVIRQGPVVSQLEQKDSKLTFIVRLCQCCLCVPAVHVAQLIQVCV